MRGATVATGMQPTRVIAAFQARAQTNLETVSAAVFVAAGGLGWLSLRQRLFTQVLEKPDENFFEKPPCKGCLVTCPCGACTSLHWNSVRAIGRWRQRLPAGGRPARRTASATGTAGAHFSLCAVRGVGCTVRNATGREGCRERLWACCLLERICPISTNMTQRATGKRACLRRGRRRSVPRLCSDGFASVRAL
jgi:hypothetical protein